MSDSHAGSMHVLLADAGFGGRTLEYLSSMDTARLLLLGVLAGLAVVVMCGALSVLVVVKRLGFVGQGVSHSAFGGIGVAALLAAMGWLPGGPAGQLVQMAIVVVFCVGAALGMAAASDRKRLPVDSSIGMFLVGSMALGAVLVQASHGVAARAGRMSSAQSWESILFGSILAADRLDVIVGWSVAAIVLLAAWAVRRPMLFWAFEEDSARAFGVPAAAMKTVLMVLLALAVVVAMKLAGVVLATALLVLPGATALRVSDRLRPVMTISILSGVAGLLGGLLLSVELDWQPGPSVVLVMTAVFVGACVVSAARSRLAPKGESGPARPSA